MLSGQAFAYDGFVDADIATCTQGNNNVDLVTACTGLIDNAEAENAVVGMFYGLRASHSDDTEQNCSDARKSLGLADDEAIRTLSQQLIDEKMRIAEVQPAFAYKPGLPRALALGDWGQIQCRALQGHKPLRDALCASMGIRDLTSGKAASRKCEVF